MEFNIENNKAVVRRFNKEVIEQGNVDTFNELMDAYFVNHTAPSGIDPGPEGMIRFFNEVLRRAMPDLTVTIHEQIAEQDLVTTRKTIKGTHIGSLLGVSGTGRVISIEVIDIVRIKDGRYLEHWGLNSLAEVLRTLLPDK